VFDAKGSGQMDAASACPPLQQDAQVAALVSEKARADDAKVAELVSKGVQPIKVVYSDGGQHPSMAHVMEVSRPEAIAEAPREIPLDAKGRPIPAVVQVAAAKAVVETPVKVAAAPAPAKATPVKPAAAPAPVAVAEEASEPSTITRLLSFSPKIPSLFGSSEAVKETETASPVPMPPPRPRASAQPVKPQASAKPQPAKPQASVVAPQPMRVAMNAPTHRVAGAAPILGSDLAR
jgi:hypothetical protein